MDVSPEYVKMCREALPTLKTDGIVLGDDSYVIVTDGKQYLYQGLLGFRKDPFHSPVVIDVIPIFRQDQLQEMIQKHFGANDVGDLHQYLNIFVEWFTASTGDYRIREVKTYEQLWLAFVMKEKYNKLWKGEQWVPIKNT